MKKIPTKWYFAGAPGGSAPARMVAALLAPARGDARVGGEQIEADDARRQDTRDDGHLERQDAEPVSLYSAADQLQIAPPNIPHNLT